VARSRPTQRQIAKEAGVSRTTVSLVLNNVPGVRVSPETRQRILRVARNLNYYPDAAARTLVSGRTHTIGFVLCQSPDRVFADAFLPEVLRGVGDTVQLTLAWYAKSTPMASSSPVPARTTGNSRF
jgi:DNA-binding LacI/PurR family transcriptional regulator